jgi:hypothetical protein
LLVCLGVTALLEFDLFHQYRLVTSPLTGGGETLLAETGGTPGTTPLVQIMAVLLLLGGGFLASRTRKKRSRDNPTLVAPMMWLAAYLGLILLGEAWVVHTTQYGSEKLGVVLLAAWVLFGLIEILSSDVIREARLQLSAGLVMSVLLALTFQQGPIYTAVANHWPTSQGAPVWLTTVTKEVQTGREVVCLETNNPLPPGQANLSAYWCTRWATSVEGMDNLESLTWRQVLLGTNPISLSVAQLKASKAKPWIVVVIGEQSIKRKYDWWAPIVKIPGITFVRIPGS